ncbi:hypothetical protein L3V77_23210 [Vibrio sp. DW001]|uniref:hypothetical protein n=1 Tax=Vibrio sp. DW001 TaxID=2912315 RepID=UPI0023B13B0A|nr:hypothetical protein [Vibrio sp. DW001]WED28847.1 hypothetical protein L3V77_23210 [Vibrio sp. DW001]
MKKVFVTALVLMAGFIALLSSLILVVPLTVAALIAGKQIEKKLKNQGFNPTSERIIEGEYEEKLSK